MDSLEETLATIAAKAKSLRDAGVVGRVTVGEVSFALADPEALTSIPSGHEPRGNLLDDPELYGGHVPERRGPPQLPQLPPDDED